MTVLYAREYICIRHPQRAVKGTIMSDTEKSSIDTLILANHAEAVNGLLYISGGGWTDTHRQIRRDNPPPNNHFGIGISVRIPWNETNQPHKFVVEVQNDDATNTVVRAEGELNVGRPPQLSPGAVQHAVLAINVDVTFPAPGGYRVIASLNGERDVRTWPFRVHDVFVPA